MTRVGITGHQKLEDPGAWSWVAGVMRNELVKMAPPLVAVTSLAVGADQLLARLVLDRGGTIHAVIPFAGIERSFAPEDVAAYRKLIRQATVEVLDTPGTDEDSYLAAGQRVVELSDLVVAVWNGRPAKGKGGTADIVDYARSLHRSILVFDPIAMSITQEGPLLGRGRR
jgi:hypothetical protein